MNKPCVRGGFLVELTYFWACAGTLLAVVKPDLLLVTRSPIGGLCRLRFSLSFGLGIVPDVGAVRQATPLTNVAHEEIVLPRQLAYPLASQD